MNLFQVYFYTEILDNHNVDLPKTNCRDGTSAIVFLFVFIIIIIIITVLFLNLCCHFSSVYEMADPVPVQ